MSLYATHAHLLAPPHGGSRQPSSTSIPSANARRHASANSSAGAGPAGMSESASSLGLGSKLRQILDGQRYAIFDVAITIQELGNVPQLHGEFAAKWNFRGKKPSSRDHHHGNRGPSAKPSLPNLKLTHASAGAGDKDIPSSSSVSIRSTSTGGSSLQSGHATPQTQSSHPMKGKSMSTPPLSLTALSKGKHRMVEKKASDPTPLRNSVNLSSTDLETVESPATTPSLGTPTSYKESDDQGTPNANARLRSYPMGEQQDSTTSSLSTMPPSTIGTVSSASSSTSYLSVPNPHSTAPTPSISMERTPSQQTTSGQSALSGTGSLDRPSKAKAARSALGIDKGDRPFIRRARSNSTSGPGAATTSKDGEQSSTRGTTDSKPLKAHTCTWDHDIRLTLRLPIGKNQDRAIALGMKNKAPLLGDGPLSATGLKLSIVETLTPATNATSVGHSVPNPKIADKIGSVAASNMHSPAHNAAIRNGSIGPDIGESEESKRDRLKELMHKGKVSTFGKVNIDLAAFAGKGKTTRKFLLKGSRTNATIKICVEMTWVGGESHWSSPPLQEGHHVTSQLKDVTGGRDASEALQRDLLLMKTPSASSTDTSLSNPRTHSDISRNASSVNLSSGIPSSFAKMHPQYKTYDHHLLGPDDARKRAPVLSQTPASADTAPGQRTSTPDDRSALADADKEDAGTDSTSSPKTPTASTRSPLTFWNTHRQSPHTHHHHHFRHLRKQASADVPRRSRGIAEIPAETIIENIFNPHSGHVDGPFTYVPIPIADAELRGEAEHHEEHPPNEEVGLAPEGGRRLWRRRNKSRTVSSMTVTGPSQGAGNGPNAGGATGAGTGPGPKPSRRPSPSRAGTNASTAIHA